MNLAEFVTKLPAVIMGIMAIVERVRNAKGAEKHRAVVEALPESAALAEFATGRDLFNDETLAALRDEFIAAEALVLNARRDAMKLVVDAVAARERVRKLLEAGILAKSPGDSPPALN